MKRAIYFSPIFLAAVLISWVWVLPHARKAEGEARIMRINKEYERRTVVRKSSIPNAGNGLFAVVRIEKGEVVGELGGLLVSDNDYPQDGRYVASIPECAWEKTHPYKYIDSKDHGGKASRINFAPSEINGIETHFQNATIKHICERPYVIFVAVKDIEPGTEIWSSYGLDYDYDRFMSMPEVRDFFCGLLKIDCREKFTYEH